MNKVDGRMEKKKFKKLLNLIEKHSNAIKANEANIYRCSS